MSHKPACPCGSGKRYVQCCGPCLSGAASATTAEQLMRSRYTAYVMNNEGYLRATWHDSTRPQQLALPRGEPVKWLGLQIIATRRGGPGDNGGTVEFKARYKINGKAYRLHEQSRFVRERGRWFYLGADG